MAHHRADHRWITAMISPSSVHDSKSICHPLDYGKSLNTLSAGAARTIPSSHGRTVEVLELSFAEH
jgi:hypothetical protein